MQAVAIDQFGSVEKMRLRQLPVPEIGADEVLIHVETAGVGVWDPFEREGGFAKEFGQQPNFPPCALLGWRENRGSRRKTRTTV